MSKRSLSLTFALAVFVALGVVVTAGQQPRIINGRVAAHAAASNLSQTFRSLVSTQSGTAWIGYTIPVTGERSVGACGSYGTTTPVRLEGPHQMLVMFRVVDRQVERIRLLSDDCEIDAGGTQVHWLQDVRPAESVALLESLVGSDAERRTRITNGAISAIALHADPAATPAVMRLAREHAQPWVRGEAIFWVAQLATRKAVGTIAAAIEDDPDTDVKKRAVFALSQLPKSEGVPLLIDVARKNRNPAVRKQAIFWLGQSRDPRAMDFFAEILK